VRDRKVQVDPELCLTFRDARLIPSSVDRPEVHSSVVHLLCLSNKTLLHGRTVESTVPPIFVVLIGVYELLEDGA